MDSLSISKDSKSLKLNGEEYEVIPPLAVASTKLLMDAYERLGSPQDPFSDSGKKVMEILISLWQDLFPKESQVWIAMRDDHKKAELSIREQVAKGTGRSLASLPMFIHKIMGKLFPQYKSWSRTEYTQFVKEYPMFRMVNKI